MSCMPCAFILSSQMVVGISLLFCVLLPVIAHCRVCARSINNDDELVHPLTSLPFAFGFACARLFTRIQRSVISTFTVHERIAYHPVFPYTMNMDPN